jgi:hypothetical protein
MCIGRKRETSSHFSSVLPMTDLSKTMKREGLRIKALISHKTVLVSGRFTFRFIPDARSFCNRQWLSVTS